jgi:hypothetical protein
MNKWLKGTAVSWGHGEDSTVDAKGDRVETLDSLGESRVNKAKGFAENTTTTTKRTGN